MAEPAAAATFDEMLLEDMTRFYDDPVGFVYYAYEWGKGELAEQTGPDAWQVEFLTSIAKKIKKAPDGYSVYEATSSGHGIGKSAAVAWLVQWAMSTRPQMKGVVTANTTAQLTTKTWAELALWHKRLINRHWFKWSATKFWHKDHPETWFVAATPNTEHNSEAFAGLHSRYNLLIFDEASAIPDKIWEVSKGAMTDPRAIWCVFGNPTRNTGAFVNCWNAESRWTHRNIDSRTCKMTNKAELAEWIKEYGEDSDFVRVRVRGVFPRSGTLQFIATDIVDRSMLIDMPEEAHILLPVVLSCDVARYGDDKTIILARQGRKVLELQKYREKDTMETAALVALAIKKYKSQLAATFVDEVGVGGGVVDRLRMLSFDVIGVNAGAKPRDEVKFYNKRAEMWSDMRDWLQAGASIPYDVDLRRSLIGCQYNFDDKERIRLERKKDMKQREGYSPDEADAIAYSFAEELGDISIQSFEPSEESFEPGE